MKKRGRVVSKVIDRELRIKKVDKLNWTVIEAVTVLKEGEEVVNERPLGYYPKLEQALSALIELKLKNNEDVVGCTQVLKVIKKLKSELPALIGRLQ